MEYVGELVSNMEGARREAEYLEEFGAVRDLQPINPVFQVTVDLTRFRNRGFATRSAPMRFPKRACPDTLGAIGPSLHGATSLPE